MKAYDLIVIGAGPGGYEAAFEAADLGMKTALVEKEALGGTCLNHGCIPTKSLLHAAELYRQLKEAGPFGIRAEQITADGEQMQAQKNDVVAQLRKGIETTAAKKKIDVYRGTGTLLENRCVSVKTADGEESLQGTHILLATGSRPALPPIPGMDLEGVVTSDELLERSEKPERLAIIGGGVIGVEFASLYAALGSSVTVIEAMPQLLPNLDREIAQSLKMLMKKRGVRVMTGARVQEIRKNGDGSLGLNLEGEDPVETDLVLVSVGRRPNTENLFGDNGQPAMERGRILVNAYGETNLPGVYAVGDVTGGIMLAHAATAAGRNAVRHMAGMPPCADVRYIPSCIYTEPEIACVGMSLDEAKAAGIQADSHKVLMTANGKTVLSGAERGYIRVVYEKESGKLLGAQMMCERASDMISEFTQALVSGLTLKDMQRAVRPHPTFCEAITEAVR
ncbi:MAG: dihydrolipoyl dehydrogenase [Clostridiales bacterium]|nr:dihydrolipoyl dehydrogenase [Clostridiales bacterium]